MADLVVARAATRLAALAGLPGDRKRAVAVVLLRPTVLAALVVRVAQWALTRQAQIMVQEAVAVEVLLLEKLVARVRTGTS